MVDAKGRRLPRRNESGRESVRLVEGSDSAHRKERTAGESRRGRDLRESDQEMEV